MNFGFKIKKHLVLFPILIFAAILLSINLNKPFIGHHDWNGAWYSNFARNFTRYGLIETKFGSVMNYDIVSPPEFRYFTHYPPLLPILIFTSFKIFGIHEWSARIVPAIFSLGTISLVYLMGRKFFDQRTAVLAAAFASVVPIMIYFGKMPVQEVLVIAPVLLSILFYFNFFEKSTKSNLLKLLVSLAISHLINWPGYYVTPLFFFHYLILKKNKNKLKIALIFPLFSLLMFSIHIIHLTWLTGKPFGGGIIEALIYRLNLSEKPQDYTTFNFLRLQMRLLAIYFTRLVLLFSTVTIFWIADQIKKNKLTKAVQLLIILAIFGMTHNLVFRNMAYIHDYMIIYLLPFFALSASFGFFLTVKYLKINSSIISILAIGLLLLVVLERRQFVNKLLLSRGFQEGVVLGKIIHNKSQSKDKILVLSPDFKKYFEVFTGFYADRKIDYQLISRETLLTHLRSKEYRLIIAIPSRDTPESLISVLHGQYQETKIDQFIIFDTNEIKTREQISLGYYSSLQ